jgi:hypothetical protein
MVASGGTDKGNRCMTNEQPPNAADEAERRALLQQLMDEATTDELRGMVYAMQSRQIPPLPNPSSNP